MAEHEQKVTANKKHRIERNEKIRMQNKSYAEHRAAGTRPVAGTTGLAPKPFMGQRGTAEVPAVEGGEGRVHSGYGIGKRYKHRREHEKEYK